MLTLYMNTLNKTLYLLDAMIRTPHLYEEIFSSMCLYSSSSARLSTYLFLPRLVLFYPIRDQYSCHVISLDQSGPGIYLLVRSITRSGLAPLSRPSESSQSSSLHLYLTIRDWTCLVSNCHKSRHRYNRIPPHHFS